MSDRITCLNKVLWISSEKTMSPGLYGICASSVYNEIVQTNNYSNIKIVGMNTNKKLIIIEIVILYRSQPMRMRCNMTIGNWHEMKLTAI